MVCDTKHEHVLRIGFYNDKNDKSLLDSYMEKFDLVISGDGSLCPV